MISPALQLEEFFSDNYFYYQEKNTRQSWAGGEGLSYPTVRRPPMPKLPNRKGHHSKTSVSSSFGNVDCEKLMELKLREHLHETGTNLGLFEFESVSIHFFSCVYKGQS